MSNIVTLPNESEWNNDLPFRENAPMAQYWFFETLKIAYQEIISKTNPPTILRHNLYEKGGNGRILGNRANMCYCKLERDGLYLCCDKFYAHNDWSSFLNHQYEIPDEDFFDINNWNFEEGIKFWVENIEE